MGHELPRISLSQSKVIFGSTTMTLSSVTRATALELQSLLSRLLNKVNCS